VANGNGRQGSTKPHFSSVQAVSHSRERDIGTHIVSFSSDAHLREQKPESGVRVVGPFTSVLALFRRAQLIEGRTTLSRGRGCLG